jgi:hypothetical protein
LGETAPGFVRGPLSADGQPTASLEDLVSGHARTVFYIAGSCELVEAVRSAAAEDEKGEKAATPSTGPILALPEELEVDTVDALVKEMSCPPQVLTKAEQVEQSGTR